MRTDIVADGSRIWRELSITSYESFSNIPQVLYKSKKVEPNLWFLNERSLNHDKQVLIIDFCFNRYLEH